MPKRGLREQNKTIYSYNFLFRYFSYFANIKHIGILLDPKKDLIFIYLHSNVYFMLVDLQALFH